MNIVVTGSAGFIGSHFCRMLLEQGHRVTGIDDLSFGNLAQMDGFSRHPKFRFAKKNLLNLKSILPHFKRQDLVIHLAANSDICKGLASTDRDLKLNTLATWSVLDAMRLGGTKNILFASTSAVYGEAKKIPTPEDYGPLQPISLYGASKLACEGWMTAYAHLFGMKCWVFRFGNVIGGNLTHGAICDFLKKLKKNPKRLQVLGSGKQRKSYILVQDCIEGMWFAFRNARAEFNVFNLSSGDSIDVKQIAELTVKVFGAPDTRLVFEKQDRGWAGDVVKMGLDIRRMTRLGWKAKFNSRQAVEETLQTLRREKDA